MNAHHLNTNRVSSSSSNDEVNGDGYTFVDRNESNVVTKRHLTANTTFSTNYMNIMANFSPLMTQSGSNQQQNQQITKFPTAAVSTHLSQNINNTPAMSTNQLAYSSTPGMYSGKSPVLPNLNKNHHNNNITTLSRPMSTPSANSQAIAHINTNPNNNINMNGTNTVNTFNGLNEIPTTSPASRLATITNLTSPFINMSTPVNTNSSSTIGAQMSQINSMSAKNGEKITLLASNHITTNKNPSNASHLSLPPPIISSTSQNNVTTTTATKNSSFHPSQLGLLYQQTNPLTTPKSIQPTPLMPTFGMKINDTTNPTLNGSSSLHSLLSRPTTATSTNPQSTTNNPSTTTPFQFPFHRSQSAANSTPSGALSTLPNQQMGHLNNQLGGQSGQLIHNNAQFGQNGVQLSQHSSKTSLLPPSNVNTPVLENPTKFNPFGNGKLNSGLQQTPIMMQGVLFNNNNNNPLMRNTNGNGLSNILHNNTTSYNTPTTTSANYNTNILLLSSTYHDSSGYNNRINADDESVNVNVHLGVRYQTGGKLKMSPSRKVHYNDNDDDNNDSNDNIDDDDDHEMENANYNRTTTTTAASTGRTSRTTRSSSSVGLINYGLKQQHQQLQHQQMATIINSDGTLSTATTSGEGDQELSPTIQPPREKLKPFQRQIPHQHVVCPHESCKIVIKPKDLPNHERCHELYLLPTTVHHCHECKMGFTTISGLNGHKSSRQTSHSKSKRG
jgi:hypothetical protein